MTDELKRYREEQRRKFQSRQKPKLLNTFFKVASYNGGMERQNYEVDHILRIDINSDSPKQHCSIKGKNFDLVLKYCGQVEDCFSITNFQILGCPKCTSPINTGILIILKELPDNVNEWGKQFNDMTLQKLRDSKIEDNRIDGEIFFFETSHQLKEFRMTFDKLLTGKCIYMKFLSAPDQNIDVRQVSIFGFGGRKENFKNYKASEEDIFEKNNCAIRKWRKYFLYSEYYLIEPCLLVVSRSQTLRELCRNLILDREFKDLVVYYLPHELSVASLKADPEEFDFGLRFDNMKLSDGVYMVQKDGKRRLEKKWKLESPFTRSRITQFIRDVQRQLKSEWIREEQPPEVALDEKTGIHTLVRSTFAGVILNRAIGQCAVCSFYVPSIQNYSCENYLEELKKIYGKELICAKYNAKENDLPMYLSLGCYFYGEKNLGRPTVFTSKKSGSSKEFLAFVQRMMDKEKKVVNIPLPPVVTHTQPEMDNKIDTVKLDEIPSVIKINPVEKEMKNTKVEEEGEKEEELPLPPPQVNSSPPEVEVERREGLRIELQGFSLVFSKNVVFDNQKILRMELKKRNMKEVNSIVRAKHNKNISTGEFMKLKHTLTEQFIRLKEYNSNEKLPQEIDIGGSDGTGRIIMVHQKSMKDIEEKIFPDILKVLKLNVEDGKLEKIVMNDNAKEALVCCLEPYFIAFIPIITVSQNILMQFRLKKDDLNLKNKEKIVNQFIEFVKNIYLD